MFQKPIFKKYINSICAVFLSASSVAAYDGQIGHQKTILEKDAVAMGLVKSACFKGNPNGGLYDVLLNMGANMNGGSPEDYVIVLALAKLSQTQRRVAVNKMPDTIKVGDEIYITTKRCLPT